MRISSALLLALLLLSGISCPVFAQEDQRSDVILEKMSYKLSRGIANMATCIVELPKQTYMTTRDKGGIGIIIGPLKGIGMTLYRGFTGVTETVFFLVPQPGYYNSMIDPEFVWNGWEDTRLDRLKSKEADDAGATSFVMPVPTTTEVLRSRVPEGLYEY
jgi:putative exosortase-associated protein (TIGR04073 family)